MKLKEVKEILNAEVVVGNSLLEKEVKTGCGSDLMSDVLTFIQPNSLLLTGLTNPQAIRTAEMGDITAICFVRGKKPQDETVKLAKEKKISLLLTRYSMLESCGRLYEKGLRGDINQETV